VGRMPGVRQHIGGSSSPGPPSFLGIASGELFSGLAVPAGLFSCPQPRAPSGAIGGFSKTRCLCDLMRQARRMLIDVYGAQDHRLAECS
jgi:hypothetical protein